jgi:hypothetical protein
MNTFYEHHHDSIRFAYRCFDRILINGLIQPFQQPERVVGFFNTYRQQYPVSRPVLGDIATQYQRWVEAHAKTWGTPIVEAPAGRRDAFVEPYFRRAKADQIVVIVKGREPARILTAIGKDDRWHLQYARRWVIQYNFYLQDRDWGAHVCPSLPLLPLLGARLLQSASLARHAHAGRGPSLPPRGQWVSDLLRSRAVAGAGQQPDGSRHRALCAEVAAGLHAVLHADGAADGQLLASTLLRTSRVL